jgi:hypothetical protein
LNKVFLFVSDISTLLGVSKYNPQNCFERLLKKYDVKTIDLIKNESINTIKNLSEKTIELNIKTEELNLKLAENKISKRQFDLQTKKIKQETNKISNNLNNTQEKLDLLTLTKKEYIEKKIGKENIENITSAKDLNEKNEKSKELQKKLETTDLPSDTIELINKEIKNLINTEYGIEKESNAIQTFEKIENVKLDTSQQFYKCHICTIDNTEYYLGGKLDGISRDYIVEVKNRTKQFFYKTRDYEMIQIQLYLYMLNYNKAKLVQKLNQKIKITDIEKDETLINNTIDKIKIFCNLFNKFLKNDDKRREYYTCSFIEKENFIYSNFYLKLESEYLKLRENEMIIDSEDEEECCISISE